MNYFNELIIFHALEFSCSNSCADRRKSVGLKSTRFGWRCKKVGNCTDAGGYKVGGETACGAGCDKKGG